MRIIEDLVNQIALLDSSEILFNPYSDCCPSEDKPDSSEIRKENLLGYFSAHLKKHAGYLWVFEAPGYRGCRRTGLPLVSENLLESVGRLLKVVKPFQKATKTKIVAEYSANVVWKMIGEIGETPLIWNAYPLHPFKKDRPFSNRTPGKQEIDCSSQIIKEVIKIFRPQKILSVGRVAERLLAEQGFSTVYVRHPANGGVGQFRRGISEIYQRCQ